VATHFTGRAALALLSAAGLLLTTANAAAADDPPPSAVLSHFETDVPGNTVDRDAGFSAAIPGTGTSLWLFGDSTWSGSVNWFNFGTTAAIGPATRGLVPTALSEVPTPPATMSAPSGRAPSPFLPTFPGGLRTPDGEECRNGPGRIPASWPTGAAALPGSGMLLIASHDVCLANNNPTIERFVLTAYVPGAANYLGLPHQVVTDVTGLPSQFQLGSPIFSDGYLYLFAQACHQKDNGYCRSGSVYLARVGADVGQWAHAENYSFWTGSGWGTAAQAASILPGAKPMSTVYAGDFSEVGKGFVVVESTSIYGDYTVWRSNTLTGTWAATRSGTTPCSDITEEGLNFCRAHVGHPELSTSTNLLLSYYNPADRHLRVTAVPW
jgi:hypothetical protein